MYSGTINYYRFAPIHYYYINVKDTRAVVHTRRLVKYISQYRDHIIIYTYDRCVFVILYQCPTTIIIFTIFIFYPVIARLRRVPIAESRGR